MHDARHIDSILQFWFGDLDEHGCSARSKHSLWFGYDPAVDREIEALFGTQVEQALHGELDHWHDWDAGLIALTVLLDQLTRNVHRGTPAAFSGDAQALGLARAAIAEGRDRYLPTIHRVFLYIPFEHCEDLDIQDEGLRLFDILLEESDPSVSEHIMGFRDYSVAHRDVIARFGRFPHRNAILGRETTPDEAYHLASHGGF